MRRPRPTVRLLMLLVAPAALATAVAREFRDDSHPPFVVRGIPARIDWLRPGMMWAHTRDILGLERHWLLGGTSARFAGEAGNYRKLTVFYEFRPARIVLVSVGTPPTPTAFYRSRASIWLTFAQGQDRRKPALNRASGRLHQATFIVYGRTLAEVRAKPAPARVRVVP